MQGKMKKLSFYNSLFGIFLASVAPRGYATLIWSITGNIPRQTVVSQTYPPVIYTFSNNAKSPSPTIAIIPGPYDSSAFSLNNTCNGQKISPNGSCSLSVTFKALKVGAYSLGLSFKEGNSPFTLPRITTAATAAQTSILGNIVQPLPINMTVGNSAPAQWQWRNSVPIWLGLSGADVHHSCNSDSDCPQGASCALATKA
jgi:hypothetical protein